MPRDRGSQDVRAGARRPSRRRRPARKKNGGSGGATRTARAKKSGAKPRPRRGANTPARPTAARRAPRSKRRPSKSTHHAAGVRHIARQPAHRGVSLERAVSKLGIASRLEARLLILEGRVRIGRAVVMNPAQRVDLATDAIWVDDRLAQPAKPLYWVLYKPVGYVTTRQDPDGRPTVYDLLPRSLPFVAPVGRLDLDSSGLLLFTNDTQFAAALTDPASHVPKVYEVLLDTAVSQREANALAAGVDVGGRRTSPARFQLVGPEPSVRLAVTLTEGRNRQVRRMFASIGRNVVELRRVQIGSLRLDGLDPGDARPLHEGELRALRDLVSRRR